MINDFELEEKKAEIITKDISSKKNELTSLSVLGRVLFLILVLYWSFIVLQNYSATNYPWIPLDSVNLMFHEAGHFLTYFFGQFIYFISGSLFQLLIPAIVIGAFALKKDWYAAGFGLFWLGESAINLSYYIKDAAAQSLPLLGGDGSIHDWNWILTQTGKLNSCQSISQVVLFAGSLFVLLGVCAMIFYTAESIFKLLQKKKNRATVLTFRIIFMP